MLKKIFLPLLATILVLLFISSGALNTFDRMTQDALFQRPGTPSDDIIIIGIDSDSLAQLGPYGPSYRTYMAYALQKLASDRMPFLLW